MILYRTEYIGINAHDHHLIYTHEPSRTRETEIVAIDVDLTGFTVGGPNDDSSMVFDASGHGYSLTYDKVRHTILLHDYAGNIERAVSTIGREQVVA